MITTQAKYGVFLVLGAVSLLGTGFFYSPGDNDDSSEPEILSNLIIEQPAVIDLPPQSKQEQPKTIKIIPDVTPPFDDRGTTLQPDPSTAFLPDSNTTAKYIEKFQTVLGRMKGVKDVDEAKALSKDLVLSSEQLFQKSIFLLCWISI